MSAYRVLSRERLELPCPLTDAEVQDRAHAVANQLAERAALVLERKAESKRLKDEIDALDERTAKAAGEIRDCAELREVECEEQLDVERKRIEWVRMDTGAIVPGMGRTATPAELQGELFSMEARS